MVPAGTPLAFGGMVSVGMAVVVAAGAAAWVAAAEAAPEFCAHADTDATKSSGRT
jgi:hypothetical protein